MSGPVAAQTSQTITFGTLASQTYGGAPFAVSATASSGLPVSFTSLTTPVCTVSGSTVTIAAAGTCTIQASQAGNTTYAPAPNVSQSFTVTKANQTISFAALAGQTYGNPPFMVSATASSGLAVTFRSRTGIVCSVSGSTVTLVAGGTCTIQARQSGNANYNSAQSVSQNFTVAPASQTISFGALTNQSLGVAPFAVSATASSGLGVTFSSLTTGTCTVSGSTVTLVAAGTCTIQAAQAGNGNYNAAPNVAQSFTITSGQASQTITFGAIANQTFGVTPFTVSASASSGLPVSFASLTTPVCTVSGSAVTIVAVGTCTIQASQAGNATYAAASNVSQSFTVAKANQTLTFGTLVNQSLGAAPFTVNATASSGLAVAFSSLTTATCTVSGSTVTLVAAGTCTIQAAQAGNANYNAAPNVTQSFTITSGQASQTITFGALANQTFGATPFTVSASASSGLPVSFASLTTPVCTVSGSAVTIVAVGTCTIQASQAGNASYSAAPNVNQSFSVAKANQTITFGALANQILGASPFTVSATASSGLAVAFASTTTPVCTVSGNTVTIVAVGMCTIQASQAGNGNYNAAPNVTQSFTITAGQASQTITFGTLANQTYGVAPFTVSATASSGLAVSFASLTTAVCAVSGGTVTIAAAGTCTIQASQAGNASYSAAPNVNQSFTVAKANQTITFGALANQSLGVAPFTVSATASSGLTVAFSSLTTSTCTVNGSTVTLVAAGTCSIQAAQAGNANYNAAPNVTQGFAITGGTVSQTITFGTLANQTYGAAPFTVSATASSGLPVSFTSLTTPVCTVSGSTVTIVAAGTCTVQASQAGNASYSAAPNVNQSFSVAKANQTITFGALANQSLGAAPFTVSATASSGLTVAFSSLTTSTCTMSGNTVTLAAAGTCTIQAAQAGNANYNAAPNVSQSFTVAATSHALQFLGATTYATGSYPSSIATGDFNGDGIPDLAVGNAFSANVSIFIGKGDGTFTLGTPITSVGEPSAVAVGDFNGDGKLDLAIADQANNSVYIFLGNGNGTFALANTVSVGLVPVSIAVADFNGDGKLDLAVANGSVGSTTGQTVTVLLGDGKGNFGSPVVYPTGPSPSAVVAADFNGDGRPDLAVVNYGNNTVSVLLNHGDGTFAAAVNYATDQFPDTLAVGDFNGDGKLDLAVGNDATSDVSILLGRGDGTFGPATNFAAGSGPAGIAVADFNGDGRADLAVVNRFAYTLTVLLGNGDGTFQAPLVYTVGKTPNAVIAKDLNLDGQPDLVVANSNDATISVLLQAPATASLTVQSGSPQSASVGTAYATPLAVLAKDAGGHAVPGASVTFTAPTTGASGTFSGTSNVAQAVSNASGLATAPAFTANGLNGTFTVLAAAGTASTSFTLTNTGGGNQAPTFTSGPAPNGIVSTPYTFTLTANGAPAPTFSVTQTALPPGLALNGTSGLLNGTPNTVGTYAGMFTAANGVPPNATQTFAITIASASQTITFGALANKAYGVGPFNISATASSGLAVSFASLTTSVCTVSGTTVTIVATGTCTIQASQAGNASYPPAPNVNQSFSVATGSQTIAFAALANQILGAAPFAVSATASSGLMVTFSALTTGVCGVVGNTVTLVTTGTCTIRAAQAGNGNYAAAPIVDQSFAVTQSPLIQPDSNSLIVNGDEVSVSGTIQAPQNSGVTVNGIVAAVDGNGRFYVDHVPVDATTTSLTIVLTTSDGRVVTQTIQVTASGTPTPVVLSAQPSSGMAPLTVTFRVQNHTGATITKIELDVLGNGHYVDVTTNFSSPGFYTAGTFSAPGTYHPSIRLTDANTHTYLQSATVVVFDPSSLDQVLRSSWTGLNNALAGNDLTTAQRFISSEASARYSRVFNDLNGQFGLIVASFGPLTLVEIGSGYATYAVTRPNGGTTRTFLVDFIQDGDGVWRVDSM